MCQPISNDELERLFFVCLNESSTRNHVSRLKKFTDSCTDEKTLDFYQDISCKMHELSIMTTPVSENVLRKVSQLLDEKSTRNFFQFSSEFLLNLSGDIIELWLQGDLNVSQSQVHMSVRVILQVVQFVWNKEKIICKQFVTKVEKNLINLIDDKSSALDTVMLAGTTFVRLLSAKHCCPNEAAIEFLSLLINGQNNTDVENNKKLKHLILLTGLLNSGNQSIYVLKIHGIPVLLLVFPLIIQLCESHVGNVYHAFQLLLSWLSAVKKCLVNLEMPEEKYCFDSENNNVYNIVESLLQWWTNIDKQHLLFQNSSAVFQNIYDVLSVNWENSIHGVPDLIKESFQTLLELHELESDILGIKGVLVQKLIHHHLKMPWTDKAKYPPLAILISHTSVINLLNDNPCLPNGLSQTLFSNPLASAGVELYRVCLKGIRREQLDESRLISLWQSQWMEPIKAALLSNNHLAHQNMFRHWLPKTLMEIPGLYSCIVQHFSQHNDECFQNALVIVMRLARQDGIVTLDNMDTNVIHESLFHLNENIRIEALALLCCSNKKAESLLHTEIDLISEFFKYNLNIDSAPFRQQLINHTKCLLIRIRDSCLSMIAEIRKNQTEFSQLQKSLDFVDYLLQLAVTNLNPGACFQRRQTCLELLLLILDVYAAPPTPKKRKGGIPERAQQLLDYAQKRNLWIFNSDEIFQCLLSCLHDFMSEIKILAIKILRKYYCNQAVFNDEKKVSSLLHQAYLWLDCPKAHISESGAILVNLIFRNKLKCNSETSVSDYLIILATKLDEQFEIAQHDLLLASKSYPMHGIILALKIYIMETDWTHFSVDTKVLINLFDQIIEKIKIVVTFVLAILAAKSNSISQAPSFADMGNAIDNILDASGVAIDDSPALSLEHQLILSCCWLTLKECSLLISKISTEVPFQYSSNSGILSVSALENAGNILVDILIHCRHRGVIEACSLALGEFCKILSSEQLPRHREIPEKILKFAMEVILKSDLASSITRRSAGLPLLFAAVISNETNARNSVLLESTITNLLKIMSTPLQGEETETVDLPQTHAIHIVRALIHDARLSQYILPYVTAITKGCIENFSSTSWAIRNASLQLFGSLLPRLLGQKKVQDELSHFNSFYAEVLFRRHPGLKEYILTKLRKIKETGHSTHHGLAPILSLLSKLYIDSEITKGNEISKEFDDLLSYFIGSPVYIIRKLSAFAFVGLKCRPENSFEKFFDHLLELASVDENKNILHGELLIVLRLVETKKCPKEEFSELSAVLKECYRMQSQNSQSSFMIRAVILNILIKTELPICNIQFLLTEIKALNNKEETHSWKPGRGEWIKQISILALKLAVDIQEYQIIKNMFQRNNQDEIISCLYFVKTTIKTGLNDKLNLFFQEQILNLIFKHPHPFHLHQSLDLVFNLFLMKTPFLIHPHALNIEICEFLKETLIGAYGSSAAASATVVMGFLLVEQIKQKEKMDDYTKSLMNIWCNQFLDHCDPRKDEDLRFKCAEALLKYGFLFFNNLINLKMEEIEEWSVKLFKSGILLLTDENWEVRQKASGFASTMPRLKFFYKFPFIHHNYGVEILVNYFSSKFSNSLHFLNFLWNQMTNLHSTKICLEQYVNEERNYTLFERDDVNIYAEQRELVKLYASVIKNIVTDNIKSSFIQNWLNEKTNVTSIEVEETVDFISKLSSHADLPCINIFAHSKPYVAIYKLCIRIDLLLNPELPKSLTHIKDNLQQQKILILRQCIPVWIT